MLYRYKALVNKVIDADTLTCSVDVGFSITVKEKFRLARINAPELKTAEGKIAKACLKDLLDNKEVEIESHGKDKYGRWLATIYVDDIEVNEWLLQSGLAEEYN